MLGCLAIDLGGKPPKTRDIDTHELMPSLDTYARHFGGLEKALETIGFNKRDILLGKLHEASEHKGRFPTKREIIENPELPSPTTVSKYFGSLPKAQKAMEDKYYSKNES